jgi:DNA polymerase-4
MATRIARRLCPKGVFLRPRIERYREISGQVFALFRDVTDRVEKVSIDEAYIDLSDRVSTFEQAAQTARELKSAVKERLGLTVSAGVAPCKFVAKIASDFDKPDGLVVVRPEETADFLAPLSVGKIPGVGKVAESKLHKLNVRTIADLRRAPRAVLQRDFGKFGPRLYEFARGVDTRPIVTHRKAKSVGSENTFERDHKDLEPILESLRKHAEKVARRLAQRDLAARTVTLKLRYDDFTSITRSRTLDVEVWETLDLYEAASGLLPKTEAGRRPVRLVGIYAAGLVSRATAQAPDFFGRPFQA